MKTSILFFVLGVVVILPEANAQDRVQTAFSQSIESETKGDYRKAISIMKEVYDEKSYEMNLRLGWLNYQSGLYVESARFYEKSMTLLPYSIEAKLGYVLPASALGNWDNVITQYKKILEIDPQNTMVNYRMGLIDYNNKRYAGAYKYFEKVINLYPADHDSLLMFAWTNFQLGKSREAKVLFSKVLLLTPKDSSALDGMSLIK